MAQWEKLSSDEKMAYSTHVHPEKVTKSKKLKKINKNVEKILETVKNEHAKNETAKNETAKNME